MVDVHSSDQQNIVEITNNSAKYYSDLAGQYASNAQNCLETIIGVEDARIQEMQENITQEIINNRISLPTKLSEFENDCNYLTNIPNTYITEEKLYAQGYITGDDMILKADKSDIYTKEEVDSLISEHLEINDFKLNNPATLLEAKYSTNSLYNASWLLSNGQRNSGDIYLTVYEALQVEMDDEISCGTSVVLESGSEYVKKGLSVKNINDVSITPFDYQMDLENREFILPCALPIRTLIKKKEPTDADPSWYNWYSDGWLEQGGITGKTGLITLPKPFIDTKYTFLCSLHSSYEGAMWGRDIGYTNKTTTSISFATNGATYTNRDWYAYGYSSIPSPVDSDSINLYFYVGETIQNANLINASRLTEQLTTKAGLDLNNLTNEGLNVCATASMPDFDNLIPLTVPANGGILTIPYDCYVCFAGQVNSASASHLELIPMDSEGDRVNQVIAQGSHNDYLSIWTLAPKGGTVQVVYAGMNTSTLGIKIVKLKGAE